MDPHLSILSTETASSGGHDDEDDDDLEQVLAGELYLIVNFVIMAF